MNIRITNRCNLNCSYCFGKEVIENQGKRYGPPDMSLDNLKKVLKIFSKSKRYEICIAGGEPTLHPGFRDLIDCAINKKFNITLLTNGCFSGDICQFLQQKGKQIKYLWNINPHTLYPAKFWNSLSRNLKVLAALETSTVGINVYRHKQNLEFIIPLIKKYQIKYLRVCIAHPSTPYPKNQFLLSSEFKNVTHSIRLLVEKAIKAGVRQSYFDCGNIYCAWRKEDIQFLRKNGFYFGTCKICLSIGTGLIISDCWQVSNPNETRHFNSFKTEEEINTFLSNLRQRYSNVFLFKECLTCSKISLCKGGCLSERKNKVQDTIDKLKQEITRMPTKDKIISLAVELERTGFHQDAVSRLKKVGYNNPDVLKKLYKKMILY